MEYIPHKLRYVIVIGIVTSPIWVVGLLIYIGEIDNSYKPSKKKNKTLTFEERVEIETK